MYLDNAQFEPKPKTICTVMSLLLIQNLHSLVRSSPSVSLLVLQYALKFSNKHKSSNVDSIDLFTNDLVVRKALKWQILQQKIAPVPSSQPIKPIPTAIITVPNESLSHQFRSKAQKLISEISSLHDVDLCIDFETLTQYHIDHLLISALFDEKKKHFYAIIDQCIHFTKGPSERVAFDVLRYLSDRGDLVYTKLFIELCSQTLPSVYEENVQFDHIRAKCMWKQGNADGGLRLLACVYVKATALKDSQTLVLIRQIFQEIVVETVGKKSEAVLVAVTNVATELSESFNEHQVLAFVWKSCFLSVWFCDHQQAVLLFEKHAHIRAIVGDSVSMTSYKLLQNHNTDAVYRLIELLLRFDMKNECKVCLGFLFEYQC